jgi:hypothetical protein
VVALGSADPATPKAAAATTRLPEKPLPYTPCTAEMFDDDGPAFIDPSGGIVIKPRFRYASAFCHGRAAVCDQCRV